MALKAPHVSITILLHWFSVDLDYTKNSGSSRHCSSATVVNTDCFNSKFNPLTPSVRYVGHPRTKEQVREQWKNKERTMNKKTKILALKG